MKSCTMKEVNQVLELYGTLSINEIAERMQVKPRRVSYIISNWVADKKGGRLKKRWTPSEDRKLIKLRGKLTHEQIAKRLNRTKVSVSARISSLYKSQKL